MKNKLNHMLAMASWAFLMTISVFLKPHGDDFQFLYYFRNNAWNANGYSWVNDCILLPRDYWRPIEDVVFTFETHFPFLYPCFHHFLIVTLCVAACSLIYRLGGILNLRKCIRYGMAAFLMFATTSMGTTLDVGGFIQVLATVCGLTSIFMWMRGDKKGYIAWGLLCAIACFCKETSFVWFPVAPLFAAFLKTKDEGWVLFQKTQMLGFLKTCIPAIIGIIVYLSLYVMVSPRNITKVVSGQESKIEQIEKVNEQKALFTTDVKTISFKFTPASFIKNVFVCWGAALLPVDTTAIYQKNYFLIGITLLLGVYPFCLILMAIIRYIRKHSLVESLLLFAMLLCVSSVSLVLRAGEISPYPNLAILAIILGLAFNDYHWKCRRICALVMFVLSTLIVDAHKYYMCYWAAEDVSQIGETLKAETKDASNVLLIQYGDASMKKDGAFIRNLVCDFGGGGAAVAAYGYESPLKMKVVSFEGEDFESLKQKVDSMAVVEKDNYSAIWIVSEIETKVINK